MSFSPRSPLQLITVALGVTLVLAVTPIAAQASVKNPTTKTVLKAAQKAMAKESGVHIYVTSKTGTVKSVVVVDIGATFGEETITSGKDRVKIIVTPTDAYLSGSSTGSNSGKTCLNTALTCIQERSPQKSSPISKPPFSRYSRRALLSAADKSKLSVAVI